MATIKAIKVLYDHDLSCCFLGLLDPACQSKKH